MSGVLTKFTVSRLFTPTPPSPEGTGSSSEQESSSEGNSAPPNTNNTIESTDTENSIDDDTFSSEFDTAPSGKSPISPTKDSTAKPPPPPVIPKEAPSEQEPSSSDATPLSKRPHRRVEKYGTAPISTHMYCVRPKSQKQALAQTVILVDGLGPVPVVKGDPKLLPRKVLQFVAQKAFLMRPRAIYICDGSIYERDEMARKLTAQGVLKKLGAYSDAYIARTSPEDTARVEARTFVTTKSKKVTETKKPDKGSSEIARWMSPEQLSDELDARFPFCMRGRMMYVLPFSMGPIGCQFSKNCVQLTDSPYVVLVTRIMARVSPAVLDAIGDGDFVKCIHSVGVPRPSVVKIPHNWPCAPSKLIIAHRMEKKEIWSFGSGYGGNSLLGKKCVALRLASSMGKAEGWLAEHMAIISVTNPKGEETFIAAGMPSGCGKTNLALMKPALPGWKIQLIGDDIAWMRFGKDGKLYAMNPENGMFGIAAGSTDRTNPGALTALKRDFVVTNTAETSDGRYLWQGLEDEIKGQEVTDWKGKAWKKGSKAPPAHANSRFAVHCADYPNIHPLWDSPKGVPISAIIYGGRRPAGIPLVTESFSWSHGVFLAAALKSEATAASVPAATSDLQHDPMGMRPFIGYNFGDYLKHWLSMEKPGRRMPKIFHVNWYRCHPVTGELLWPGFGENIRVLEWIIKRTTKGQYPAVLKSAYGYLPRQEDLSLCGLQVDFKELFKVEKKFLETELKETRDYFRAQLYKETPARIGIELSEFEDRITRMR
uniref:Phosphoenolpyruvate carboxykinase [GTP] n=1 Tax=Panagrellus redivivus TaxID=6233 RepID=A0A7E4WCG3_PANRE